MVGTKPISEAVLPSSQACHALGVGAGAMVAVPAEVSKHRVDMSSPSLFLWPLISRLPQSYDVKCSSVKS